MMEDIYSYSGQSRSYLLAMMAMVSPPSLALSSASSLRLLSNNALHKRP